MDAIQETFLNFHAENPFVYSTLVRLAQEVKAKNKLKWSIKALWEVMRWELEVKTDSLSEFQLNNNFPSRYARLIMEQEPNLAGMFNIRLLGFERRQEQLETHERN